MSTAERAAPLASSELLGDLASLVDQRTLDILERRRGATVVRRRGWLVRRALAAADLVGLTLAFFIALQVFPPSGPGAFAWAMEFLLFVLTLPLWVVVAKLYGLYDRDEERPDHSTVDEAVGVFHMVTVGTWLFVAGGWATGWADPRLPKLAAFWLAAVLLVGGLRIAARAYARKQTWYLQNTLIIGAGEVGQLIGRKLLQHPEYGLNLVGFVDPAPRERRADLEHLAIIGELHDVPALVKTLDVERVIFAFSNERAEDLVALARTLSDADVQVDIVPRLFELVGPAASVHTIEALPVVGVPPVRLPRSSRLLKRALDVAGAAVGLVLAAPLFAYAAWRISRESPGPIFFRQTRLGMNMREFTALKFRTMYEGTSSAEHEDYIARSANGVQRAERGLFKLEREAAVTRSGRWLRRTSLDELPQLINVLRGEMSLVGPRPCIPYETKHFKPHHFDRFGVPAGITGLWQVSARAHCTFTEALDMDATYARGWSLGLDLRILLRTPLQLVTRSTR